MILSSIHKTIYSISLIMVCNMTKTEDKQEEYNYHKRVPQLFGAFTLVALFGWAVSTFLTGIHFWGLPLPDGADPQGSILVLTSEWAYVFGIPLALLGAFYYLSVILAAAAWFQSRHPLILKVLTPVTASGVVFSAYFVYLQLVPIGEICPFCMMSAASTVILFGLEVTMLRLSDLPPLDEMTSDWTSILARDDLIQLAIIAAVGLIAIGAFFGVTLAPLPGA